VWPYVERELSSHLSMCAMRPLSSPRDADVSMPLHDLEEHPLGQDNVGRQMLLKMGWVQDAGLGPRGNGRRVPVTDHFKIGQKQYAREEDAGGARLGVALASELYHLEQTSKTDWQKGSSDCSRWEDLTAHFDRAGMLADREKTASVRPQSPPAYRESVDAWSDEIFMEHTSTGKKVLCKSDLDAQRLKDRWAAEEKLDKLSTSADHFFACCKATLGLKWQNVGLTKPGLGQELDHPQLSEALGDKTEFTQQEWNGFGISNLRMDQFVKSGDGYFKPAEVLVPIHLLCIETTGKTFEFIAKAATGRELKQILQRKLQGSLRVLGPRYIFDVAGSEDGQQEDIRATPQHAVTVSAARDFSDSGGEDGNLSDNPLPHISDDIVSEGPSFAGGVDVDVGISAQSLEVLGRDFQGPARSSDEESLSSRVTAMSVNPGHHACERLAERRISDEHIRLAKKSGRLAISIEQKRGGDPEFTTYQLNCKRESLRELGKRLENRFPSITANEPVEKGKGRGVHRRLEMLLDGSEGLGPVVKRLLDEEHQGFRTPRTCARCEDVHIIRLKFIHEISENNTLVVVEGRGKQQSSGAEHRPGQRQTPISAWKIVTTYFHNRREKHAHGEGEAVSRHLSLFGITRKEMGDDPGGSERNLQASCLLGCDVFGRAYLVCRNASGRVHDYFLADFIRDFPAGP